MSSADPIETPPPAKILRLSDEASSATQAKKEADTPTAAGSSSSKMENGSATDSAADVQNGAAAAQKLSTTSGDFDRQLYSRQLYAIGELAMRRLRASRVLVSGMGAVGVEVAKNLILGGVRHVTVHDTEATAWRDLSAQYYLSPADVGTNRAQACHHQLQELNDSVDVRCLTTPLGERSVHNFDVLVLTDMFLTMQCRLNQYARKHGKKVIVADAWGLVGAIFNDFGLHHSVDDPNGEECQEFLVELIDPNGDLTTHDDVPHGLEDGDCITFREVKGMRELNGCAPRKVKVVSPTRVNIGDVSGLGTFEHGGGIARQVKMAKEMAFHSIEETIAEPTFLCTDFAKFDRAKQLHAFAQALHCFREVNGKYPRPRCEEDANWIVEQVEERCREGLDEALMRQLSYQAAGNLCPMAAFVGGVAAQEVMKAVTGIYTPIHQWLYFDALECLPAAEWSRFPTAALTEKDCAPRESRYDGQAAVFGWDFQEALGAQHWFIVGAGAIGCELLKNAAMMGLCCGDGGQLTLTDMDSIEISNLNRQFLFRKHDVGERKSDTAARAARAFNGDLRIRSLAERVGGDTEHLFDDAFFQPLNGVANALDNVEARQYMDRRCVYYKLALLESGTMGPKGNTQVVYPHVTESYGASTDPPERDIPICTLKNFPSRIEHTIQWARDLFEGLFTIPAEDANQFIDDERAFLDKLDQMNLGQKLEVLERVKTALITERPASAEKCVVWARKLFEENFHNQIAQLLFNFPADRLTAHNTYFWSGSKRCPHTLSFDPHFHEAFEFVYAASVLRAEQYGLEPITDRERVGRLAAAVEVPPFEPRRGVRIATTDSEAQQHSEVDLGDDIDKRIEDAKLALARVGGKGQRRLEAIDFEKDDDANHHIDFITACSNLRAMNYSIEIAERMKTKQIAGRIIPAIATTTAAIAGLACLELYKMVAAGAPAGRPPLDIFKNGFVNLALPLFAFSEPVAPEKKKMLEEEFTQWDCIEVNGPLTLKAFIDFLKREHGVDVSMLSSGVSLLFSGFMNPQKRASRLAMELSAVVADVTQRPVPAHVRALVLELMATDADDEDIETPYVKYLLPSSNKA